MSEFLSFLTWALFIYATNSTALWTQENIGEVTHWFYNKKGTKAYVSTAQSVIACLDLEHNGNLIWRQVLDEKDTMNDFRVSSDGKSLLTLTNGNVLRKWRKRDGALMWESKQFEKLNSNQLDDARNAAMQFLDHNKVILIDNMDTLSVIDQDDGQLIWKQSTSTPDSTQTTNGSHIHRLYADQSAKIVYIVTFDDVAVSLHSFSLTTGDPVQSTSEFKHECISRLSVPKHFEVLPSPDADGSLIVYYQCPDDVTPLYAFSFSADLQIAPLSVSFDTAPPALEEWTMAMNGASVSLSMAYGHSIEVGVDSAARAVSLSVKRQEPPQCDDEKMKNRGKIKRSWTPKGKGGGDSMGILTEDGSLCFKEKGSSQIAWCREEALASPVSVFLFDAAEDESSLCTETMNEEQCEDAYNAPFPSFASRLAHDVASLLTLSGFNVNEMSRKFHSFFPITSAWRDETFESIITILTESGTLFGLSSAKGHQLWSINLKHLCHEMDGNSDGNYRIITMLKVRQHPPHLLAILGDEEGSQSKIISISSPFDTQQTPHIHMHAVDTFIENAFVTPWITKDHSDKIVVLIGGDNTMSVYPPSEQTAITSNAASIFYHSLRAEHGSFSGHNLGAKGSKLWSNTLWTKVFASGEEEVVDVVFSAHDQLVVNSVYRTGERGAIYKYLNPHLIGVATVEPAHKLLHIYLMDGVTGRVYLHQYHHNVEATAGGISMLLYENKFMYSLFNTQTMLTEITSIDLWMSNPQDVPTKGRTPSEGYVVGDNPLDGNIFSSFNAPLPYITSQSYNFGFVIDELLCVTNTKYSVSNKWIIAKLSSGSIIQIDAKFVNTRRPITYEPTQANKEEHLMPYKKNIPFSNLWTISEANTLKRIHHGVSVGSPIESTSLFFAYGGLDLFFRTINPAKNFDSIPADFDFLMLGMILTGVVVAIVVAKQMAQSKKINKEWK